MAKPKTVDNEHASIAKIVIDSEYAIAKRNQNSEVANFESLVGMLECKRNEKDYDWMSDIYFPEMNALFHTERAGEVAQYFPTRDFVNVKLDGETEIDQKKALAAKKCINKTLNRRGLYYYPKFVRLRSINSLFGRAYIIASWERETTTDKLEVMDAKGKKKIVEKERIIKDWFNFDTLDPRNVFTDSTYTYSIQDKNWVTVQGESTYEKLKEAEKLNQFINLNKVKEAIDAAKKAAETDTSKESYNKDESGTFIEDTPVKTFDVIDRYGKFWAIVTEVNEKEGYPVKATPGVDETGNIKDGAELIETIISFALIGSQKIMIRFVPTPFIDATGKPFKPLARSWCYVHPTKDCGLGDGQHMREIQIAENDNLNMSMDRTKLATLPTFKYKKMSNDDNLPEYYFEPEHGWPVENMDDIMEFKVQDNIQGALQMTSVLSNAMQRVVAISPPRMGGMPDKASTTATAIAGAESNTNTRASYKSMTVEFTFFLEFYWLILQMTHCFAKSETALKMMGEDAYFFDANEDYTYTPLSSNIETEYNKNKKVQQIDQLIGRLSGLAKGVPEVIPIIAYLGMQAVNYLVGEEDPTVKHMIEKLTKAKFGEEGKQPDQVKDGKDTPTSNQAGMPISGMEGAAREGAMPAGGMIK